MAKDKQIISDQLRKLAEQAISIDDNGDPLIRAFLLAKTIWIHALGGKISVDIGDTEPEIIDIVVSGPQEWAIKLLLERLEGKVPLMVEDPDAGKMVAVNRINELHLKQLNNIAEKHGFSKNKTSKTDTEEAISDKD